MIASRGARAIAFAAMVATLLAPLAGCNGSSPAPTARSGGAGQQRTEVPVVSTAPDAAIVKESVVSLYAPLSKDYPEHPEECDWISYLRYHHAKGPADATKADAIITAMPGSSVRVP